MARRGPPPRPDALAKLGPKRHRKKQPSEKKPTLKVGAPKITEHIAGDPIASALWKRLCKHLMAMRVLGPQDGAVLEGLCVAYSRAVRADEIVRTKGLLAKRRGGTYVTNPAVRISTAAWRDVRAFAQEFGLTPSAATRVRAIGAEDEQAAAKESAEAFLFRGGGQVVGKIGRKEEQHVPKN